LEAARSKAYAALEFVEFRGKTARTDIARKAAALEHATIANLREEGTVS
jgi:phosphoribosylamine-glycine ligase